MGTALTWLGLCVGGYLAFAVATEVLHRRRLQQKTGGWSRDRFLAAFAAKGIDRSIAAAVYDFYQNDSGVESYRVSPFDGLDNDYGKPHEEIDEDASHILKNCSLELPAVSVLREWPKPIRTVEDMVLWVDWVRQHQQ